MAEFSRADLRRLQLVELDILEVVTKFCEGEGIRFFLDAGTLLGAVRHGGFIPWDDDIDIAMPREDYERFLSLADGGLPQGYSIHTFENTPGYAGMFAKVYKDGTRFATAETEEAGCPQGIFIDVFPYDCLPSESGAAEHMKRQAALWQRISYVWHSRVVNVPAKGVAGAVLKAGCWCAHYALRIALRREKLKESFDRAAKCEGDLSDGWITLAYPECGPYSERVIFPLTEREFEGRRFPCPHDVEAYLGIMYGSTWSELPPESERRTHAPLFVDFGSGSSITA